MKLHHLRDFVAIAHAESIRCAARALGLAQPALSRSLRELEADLGLVLVERHAHGVHLTEAGKRFLMRASSVMEELRRAEEEAAQFGGGTQGRLALGLSPAAQTMLLPEVFPRFRAKYPEVVLTITEALFPAIEPQLHDGTLDFYVGPRPIGTLSAHLQCTTLWKNDRVVAARRGHPLASAKTLAVSDLVDFEWLLTGIAGPMDEELKDLFRAKGDQWPKAITRVNSMLSALILLNATNALVLLPKFCLDSPVFKAHLVILPTKENVDGPDIVQVQKAGVPLTPVADFFFTHIQRFAPHVAIKAQSAPPASEGHR